jgi:hypothetical protein
LGRENNSQRLLVRKEVSIFALVILSLSPYIYAMKSKLLLLAFILAFTAVTSYSQIPEVMVGDTGVIGFYYQTPIHPWEQGCGSQDFYLHKHSSLDFFYTITQGKKTKPDSISWGHDPNVAEIFFTPKVSGLKSDSVSFLSFWICGAAGHNYAPFQDSVFNIFSARGIDSITIIKIKDSLITFPIDTQARKYKSKAEPFYFYSNIADSVLFDSWQLVVDPTAKINFTIDSGSAPISEYYSKPFTRKKQLNFTFTSGLLASDTAHSFPVTMKTRVRYKGVDSIYSNNFTIFFPPAPRSGVDNKSVQDISFTINPNPFSKSTTFTVATSQRNPITLEIYDILAGEKL